MQRNTILSTPLTQTVYTSHINRSHAKCKTLVRESSAVNIHHTSTPSLISPSPTAAAPYLPPKHPTLAHGRETNATCFIAPACTVTDTPLPPGRPAGQLGPSCLLTPHTPKISQRNPPLDLVLSLLHPFNGGEGVRMYATAEHPVSGKSGTPTSYISQDSYQPSITGTVLVSPAPVFLK